MRPVLANLGFVLQLAGLLTLLPIGVAFYYGETDALISFFLTAIAFLGSGFILNALAEKRELDFRTSAALITLVFLILGLFGSIPFLYLGVFSGQGPLEEFTNSYFEATSGFTTTGFSLISDVDSLPRSLVFYRALTQFIGGIGLVFILLAFLYPGRALIQLGRAVGAENLTTDMRRTFLVILLIYSLYAGLFSLAFYNWGVSDPAVAVSLAFSGLATGGFSPVSDFRPLTIYPLNVLLALLMVIGATSFLFHYRLFRGWIRQALTPEILAFPVIILLGGLSLMALEPLDISTAIFHAVSASTTTGYGWLDLSGFKDPAKLVLVPFMFIGGASFSTASGIKLLRLLLILKAIPWAARRATSGVTEPLTLGRREVKGEEVAFQLLVVIVAAAVILAAAFLFVTAGYPFVDSLFEVTSAYSNVGLSVGLAAGLPLGMKWLLALVMVLGRVETVPVFVVLFGKWNPPEVKLSENLQA